MINLILINFHTLYFQNSAPGYCGDADILAMLQQMQTNNFAYSKLCKNTFELKQKRRKTTIFQ